MVLSTKLRPCTPKCFRMPLQSSVMPCTSVLLIVLSSFFNIVIAFYYPSFLLIRYLSCLPYLLIYNLVPSKFYPFLRVINYFWSNSIVICVFSYYIDFPRGFFYFVNGWFILVFV